MNCQEGTWFVFTLNHVSVPSITDLFIGNYLKRHIYADLLSLDDLYLTDVTTLHSAPIHIPVTFYISTETFPAFEISYNLHWLHMCTPHLGLERRPYIWKKPF